MTDVVTYKFFSFIFQPGLFYVYILFYEVIMTANKTQHGDCERELDSMRQLKKELKIG